MKENPRAAMAYVAIRLSSNLQGSSIYDDAQRAYIRMDGTVTFEHVNIYDYEQNVRIQGNNNGGTFALYHYGDGHNIELVVNGVEFSGYDYGEGNRFTGTVSGNSAQIYDFATGSYHNYSL